jgi:GNAT superfamily N-acetyltransferase
MASSTVLIRPAATKEDMAAVAQCFQIYAKELGVDLSFQQFDDEVAGFPGKYYPQAGGALLLALDSVTSNILGCVALRAIDIHEDYPPSGRCCEVKRLFVYPEARGRSVARLLIRELVKVARDQGYNDMVLDTLARLRPALKLYESEGFVERPPYYYNPHSAIEPIAFRTRALAPTPQTARSQ